jgi:plasmid stabilization system protein ParE
MARLIWTEPALADLDGIADFIALDDPVAAKKLVRRVFDHVEQLLSHPESGSVPPELRKLRPYRQIFEKPCRIFYRVTDDGAIYIVHVMRGEMLFKRSRLTRSE